MESFFIPMFREKELEAKLGEKEITVANQLGWLSLQESVVKENETITIFHAGQEVLYLIPSFLAQTYAETPPPRITICRAVSEDEQKSLYPLHKTCVFKPEENLCLHFRFPELRFNYPVNITLNCPRGTLLYTHLEIIPFSPVQKGSRTGCHQLNLAHLNLGGMEYLTLKLELLNGELIFSEKIFLKEHGHRCYPSPATDLNKGHFLNRSR